MQELTMNEIKQVNGGAWWTRAAIGVASAYLRSSGGDGAWLYNDGNFRTSKL
ncbi:MAG: class IIb bacteriocin, lactobin A/cerein 7B family [Shewanella sp.]